MRISRSPAQVRSCARAQLRFRRQVLAADLNSGRTEAVLVHDADPVHGLPATVGARDALLAAPFIASFSSFLDDTTALADLILPSHLPLEDWGTTVPSPAPAALP